MNFMKSVWVALSIFFIVGVAHADGVPIVNPKNVTFVHAGGYPFSARVEVLENGQLRKAYCYGDLLMSSCLASLEKSRDEALAADSMMILEENPSDPAIPLIMTSDLKIERLRN
jgi:hypothetical protein